MYDVPIVDHVEFGFAGDLALDDVPFLLGRDDALPAADAIGPALGELQHALFVVHALEVDVDGVADTIAYDPTEFTLVDGERVLYDPGTHAIAGLERSQAYIITNVNSAAGTFQLLDDDGVLVDLGDDFALRVDSESDEVDLTIEVDAGDLFVYNEANGWIDGLVDGTTYCILTETDAPYLAAEPGSRSEPAAVVGTVAYLAELRGWSPEEARERVWSNYRALIAGP